MGFFLDESQVAIAEAAQKRQAPKPKKEAVNIHNHPRGCDACPLQEVWSRISTPRMPISGNLDGDILVLGEGPGEQEDLDGEPFVGKTGKFLRQQFPYKDLERLAFSNSVRCRPPGNRTPTGLEMHCCSEHLELDISKSNFKAVLLVGSAAQMRFIPDAAISQIHGIWFPIEIGKKVLWAFPIFHPSFVERTGGDRSPNYPCFRADIKRFFKEVDKRPKPQIFKTSPDEVICINREDDARELYQELRGVIGLDLETAKITKEKVGAVLKPREKGARIITAALSDGEVTFAFPVEHPSDSNNWAAKFLLEVTQQRQWVAHQSSFEFKWLLEYSKRLNIDWKCHAFDDSMAIARLHHNREVLLGLDVVSHIFLGTDIKRLTNVSASRIMEYPLEEILPYNGLDAWASARIVRLNKEVNEYNYQHIVRAERSFSYMEIAGVPVDLEMAKSLQDKWSEIAEEAEKEALTIYEAKQFMRERQQEFNIGNPDHVGRALVEYGKVDLPKTPAGKSYSTDDSILSKVAETNPLARAALKYREATKHGSTYVDPILRVPERFDDGCLHGGYTSMRTATLRSSGEDPNMQNFPKRRHRELRKSIAAPPGHVILACDSGQIQARVFGMASKDRLLCQSFIDHVDIHTRWLNRALEIHPEYIDHLARETNEKDEKKIRKKGRDTIKSDFVFASFFGSTAESCADRTGIPLRKTRELLEEFWGSYPEALKWLQARRSEYQDTGGVHTLTGRFRYGVMSGNEPIITPIQGGEAEFIIGAQNDLSEEAIETGDFYLHPRLNVHDDLTFIVPDEDDKIEYYINKIAYQMTRVRFPWQIVPLTVEAQVGYNWCDLTEVCVIEGDYHR